ncbi:MAG: hypothetical protein Q9195_008905 [Heterodermia aff. obscurata]
MAGRNFFDVFADDNNDIDTVSNPFPETIPVPTLNSSAHEPEESFHDFQTVIRKEKPRYPKPATTGEPGSSTVPSKEEPQSSMPSTCGEPVWMNSTADHETTFSINADPSGPKSKSTSWSKEKAAEMKEHKAESKARKVELKAQKADIQASGPDARRERAAEMKARKDNIRKMEKEAKEQNAPKERKKEKQFICQVDAEVVRHEATKELIVRKVVPHYKVDYYRNEDEIPEEVKILRDFLPDHKNVVELLDYSIGPDFVTYYFPYYYGASTLLSML